MSEFILHHYDTSPFSEKVRLFFGLKNLSWRSVIQPNMMPKPDLIPLTGGYRRAPVMQIGADVFCDTQVILAEIERRHPGHVVGPSWAVNLWADRLFFMPSVAVIFGELGDAVPKDFIADREKMSGRPFDVAGMKAMAGPMQAQWRAKAAWMNDALDGRDFLEGDKAALADIAAYMNFWFVLGPCRATGEKMMAGFTRIPPWILRVREIGHGTRTEMTTAEALEIARNASPENVHAHDDALAKGARVSVMPDDYGRDPVVGELVSANAERIVIARDDERLGRLHVHFPRAGYLAFPA